MKDLRAFMDSTYLKTAEQAGISEVENLKIVEILIQEAIEEQFKLAMIRPQYVKRGRDMVDAAMSNLVIGTVIDFPEGSGGLDKKLSEASQAILDGVDELDFVLDYKLLKKGDLDTVKKEVLACTRLGLENGKVVKWIIEVAALSDLEIVQATALIKNVVMGNFDEEVYEKVFVKSSTGFYETKDGSPNGATVHSIVLMLENAGPLPVKASGGVRDRSSALEMIGLGVQRIGTSSAKIIVDGVGLGEGY